LDAEAEIPIEFSAFLPLVAVLFLGGATPAGHPGGSGPAPAFELKSPAFSNGSSIPKRYTCDGPNVSPLLAWMAPPAGTQSFALIMDDPDAPRGTWAHWVLYAVPAEAAGLPENMPQRPVLDEGTQQGLNDFHKIGYNGPCPPPGKAHRYSFRLYALKSAMNLGPAVDKASLERAMKGHILAQAELIGLYQR
jgi:Raf kinase inhibitor-like YbhB/YbcL family protein